MHIFYTPNIQANFYQFTEEESKHCIRVLRLTTGDELILIDGRGMRCKAVIIDPHPKRVIVEIIEKEVEVGKRNYSIHLAFAPTKNIERVEWMLEKCTELGVDEFTPIICEHSERKELRVDRLEKIIVAAVKQSIQAYMPIIHEPISFKKFIAQNTSNLLLMAHCAHGDKKYLSELSKDQLQKTLLMIGPEGDFSSNEISLLQQQKHEMINLGDQRLRSETACLAAVLEVHILNRN